MAVLVTTFTVPLAVPTSAEGLNLGLPGPVSSLNEAFSKSAVSYVEKVACPATQAVSTVTSTIPGVNTLTDALSKLLCALSVIGYAYRTTYYPASGPPQVRYFRALAGLPALLDVDGNGLPDFTGLVGPSLTIPGIDIGINRLLMRQDAKVKIEAVFLDPIDPETWVGVGEDGSANGTAKQWHTTIGAFLASGTSVDLQLRLHAQNAPASLATLGEAFFGSNPDAPTAIDRGSMNFAPVPTNLTTRLRIGPSSQQANVTSTAPTVLTVNVQVIKPGNEKDIDVVVNQLPTEIEITHQTTDAGHELITYSANDAIGLVSGAYHDRAGTSILTAAQIDIIGLPSALTLDQFDGKTVLSAPNGVIGAVEVRFATGQEVPAVGPGTGPYVAFHRYSSSRLTAALRLASIKSVSFDSTGPYVGDIVFASAPGFIPLSFVDDVSGISATGHLSNLPAHLTVTIDLDNGKVIFDGHGTGIDEIAVSATKSTGTFFTRASRVDLTITDLPALDTITFKPDGTSANFTPSAPIGSVSLLASDGTGAPAVSGDYASYEDTPSLYRIYLQMLDIAGLSFSTAPTMTATLKTGTSLPMTLFAHIADAASTSNLTFTGTIENLPAEITVTADLDNGHVAYNANSTINRIHVTANDTLKNFFGRVNTLDLDIGGLPMSNVIDFEPSGQQVKFTPSSPIGSVSLLASNGFGAPVVPAGHHYVSYEDTVSMFRIYLKMLEVSGVAFNAPSDGPIMGTVLTGSAKVMDLYAHLADASHNMQLTGSIDKVPSHIDFTVSLNNNLTVVKYNAHGQKIDKITLHGTGLYNPANGGPLPLGIDTLHVEVDDIPSYMEAVLSTANGTSFSFSPFETLPNDDVIGRILVQAYPAATGPHNSVPGHQTAYGNLQTGQFTADIHDIGRTFFEIRDSTQNIHYEISSAQLDYEFVQDDGKFLRGAISNPTPATLNFNMAGKVSVHYRATTDTQINSITLQTDLAGGYIDADLQNIAPDVKVCFSSTNKACQPDFVPKSTIQVGDTTFNMPPALMDFSLVPTNLAGDAWGTRFEVDGTYCFEAGAATCLDSSNKERIKITDLKFGKVEVGAGFRSFDCTGCTAGRAYAYFDTDNTLISGNVKYFGADDDNAFVEYHTDSDSVGIQAENKILFVDYCLPTCIDYDDLTLGVGGSFSCVGSPHLDIDIPVFDDIDVLSGSFIKFC